MDPAPESLPDDVAALKAALIAERARRLEVAAELAVAQAKASEDMALIAAQKLRIAKLERQVYGQRSERSARLIDQLALEFEELAATATEDELAAEQAAAKTTTVRPFTRRRAERDTFPDHLPRERVVIDPPTACACCGGNRLRKLGEDVTQTLETTPRRWKVIETVREKFSCRDCETISQAPAPFHVIPRAWAGPSLLAMIVFEKFGQHQPLNRQADRYALEGAPIALSTMADAVGAVSTALDPLRRLIEAHVMAAERLHGDDTTVPVLAKGKTDTGRLWIYVRDDQPVRRRRAAGRDLPLLARSAGRASAGASRGLRRHPAGGRLRRLQQALSRGPQARPDPGGGVLGACAAQVLRSGRHRGERAPQGRRKERDPALADRHRGGAPHRRAVCHRASKSTARAPRSAWRSDAP